MPSIYDTYVFLEFEDIKRGNVETYWSHFFNQLRFCFGLVMFCGSVTSESQILQCTSSWSLASATAVSITTYKKPLQTRPLKLKYQLLRKRCASSSNNLYTKELKKEKTNTYRNPSR